MTYLHLLFRMFLASFALSVFQAMLSLCCGWPGWELHFPVCPFLSHLLIAGSSNCCLDTIGTILAVKEARWIPKVYCTVLHFSSVANCETIWQQLTQSLKIISSSSEWWVFKEGSTNICSKPKSIIWRMWPILVALWYFWK